MRTYTYHGYFQSVISSSEKVLFDDGPVAEFVVTDYDLYKWSYESKKARYEKEKDRFLIFGNKWNIDVDVTFWRPCMEDDSIEINVQRQLYSNIWGSVELYLTKKKTDMLDTINHDIRVGNFSKDGFFYMLLGEDYNVINKSGQFDSIRVVRNNSRVYMEYKEGEAVKRIELVDSLEPGEYMIGFAATFGCNSFYEWTFSNYINVVSDYDCDVPIDYLCNTYKNWTPHSSDYFMDYQCESLDEIEMLGYSELDFVKRMIQMGRYVEVEINDNLNMGVSDEHGAYFHQNFIYGFDDDERRLYLLYVIFGQIVSNCLSYDDFESTRNRQVNRKYYIYKYNPGYEGCSLPISRVLQMFKEFQSSTDVSAYYGLRRQGYTFGLNCYRELLSQKGFSRLLHDIRVSHLLYERSACNRDRIEYLIDKYMGTEEDVRSLRGKLNEECEKTLVLRNIVLKKHMGGKIDEEKLKEMVLSIVSMEESITDEMIVFLEKIIS